MLPYTSLVVCQLNTNRPPQSFLSYLLLLLLTVYIFKIQLLINFCILKLEVVSNFNCLIQDALIFSSIFFPIRRFCSSLKTYPIFKLHVLADDLPSKLHQEPPEEQLLCPKMQYYLSIQAYTASTRIQSFTDLPFLLRSCDSMLSFVSVHVAGFGQTGDQQEARRRLLLYRCHNCCFDRHIPGLSDEVIILSAISKTFMQVMFGNSKRPFKSDVLKFSFLFCRYRSAYVMNAEPV